MEDKSTPAGLTSSQLARLWSIGTDAERRRPDGDTDQRRHDLLLDRLAGSLPPDQALIELLPKILGSLCQQLRPFAGESLRTLLLDPKADLCVIERIKDHAKELGAAAGGEIEREVALALYFAAIAAGLLNHETKISQHSWKHLERSFRTLSSRPWVPADLLQLFTRAASYCKGKQ
jgi:hypothetical protein